MPISACVKPEGSGGSCQITIVTLVGRHLRLQGDREHLPRSLAHDLIEHRTARLVGLGLVVDYLEHGRTLPDRRANAGTSSGLLWAVDLPREGRTFTSLRRGPSTGSDHCSPG